MLTHLDLFSGIGGFSLAARRAYFLTVGFSEIDPFCSKVLKKHWPNVPNFGDIKKLNYKNKKHVNLITGSARCQPFSIAGKKKSKDDEQSLWLEMLRIIRDVKPCWVVTENVSGIVSLALNNILSDLEKEGYTTGTFLLPACAANAPHRRDRVWIVANRTSKRCNHCKHNRSVRDLPKNEERYVQKVQAQWTQFAPLSWSSSQAKDWLKFNTRASRRDDGVSSKMERIKALGNAIVPQVAYPILALIHEIEFGKTRN